MVSMQTMQEQCAICDKFERINWWVKIEEKTHKIIEVATLYDFLKFIWIYGKLSNFETLFNSYFLLSELQIIKGTTFTFPFGLNA